VHNNKQKYTVYTRTTQIYMYERVCGHCWFAVCVCVRVRFCVCACIRAEVCMHAFECACVGEPTGCMEACACALAVRQVVCACVFSSVHVRKHLQAHCMEEFASALAA
jgi:hypothetical protein